MKKYALSLTSAFNSSALLKARLLMLYKKPSAKVALGKYGFVVPVLGLCLFVNACLQRELPNAQTTQNPRTYWVRTVSGEMVETIYFEGEKNDYEKIADKIGLNQFLDKKENQSINDILAFHKSVLHTAKENGATEMDAMRMQGMLVARLLHKGFGKENLKDFGFLVENLLAHDFFPYMLDFGSQHDWLFAKLPELKRYWTNTKFSQVKQTLVEIYAEHLKSHESFKEKNLSDIEKLKQKLQFLKSM